MAHIRVPAGHGRDGAAHRVPDAPLLHTPDRNLLHGGVHTRFGTGLAWPHIRTGAAGPFARSCGHRRDVAGTADHRVLHLPAVTPRRGDGHRGHGDERGSGAWPDHRRLADRHDRLALHLPYAHGDRRGLGAAGRMLPA